MRIALAIECPQCWTLFQDYFSVWRLWWDDLSQGCQRALKLPALFSSTEAGIQIPVPPDVVSMRLTLIKSLQYCSVCHVCVCSGEDVRQEVSGDGEKWHMWSLRAWGPESDRMMVKPRPCPWQAVETWASLFNFFKSFCHLLNGDCVSN